MAGPSQVETVFSAALERKTAEDRAAYLDQACAGDAALRRRVDRLLAVHPLAVDFLARPAVERAITEAFEAESQAQTFPMDLAADTERDDAAGADSEDVDLSFLSPASRPGSLGRIGHYEVLENLSRGGFGIVFRAFDEKLQRIVAIKVLAPRLAVTAAARRRFLREARASAMVRHENVVQVYAVEEQPLPYLVMEFIPGETLQQRLDRSGALSAVEVAQIGRQVAEGLAAAHSKGLIHRDIKPANILIEAGPPQRVKITDFGLARAADDASLSQAGIIAGTPMYMAPEQALGAALDHRADLFSLGSVLYTMCSGRPPFRAISTVAALKRVAEESPRPIPEIIPDVPDWLCAIIARLHAKKPEERIATAREVANLLGQGPAPGQGADQARWLAAGPTAGVLQAASPRAPADTSSATRQPRRRTRGRVAVAAVVLMLAGALAFTEARGVTDFRGTVIRMFSPEGTLVVEIDDPEVSVKIEGPEIVISGAGVREIHLKPGKYQVEASKDGQVVNQELVTITKNRRQVVRVSHEPLSRDARAARLSAAAAAWERSVRDLPAGEQVKAVIDRLKELNPGFDGRLQPAVENGVVTGVAFQTEHVSDISPLRVFTGLKAIDCVADRSNYGKQGLLIDLSPLKGLRLERARIITSPVFDLSPLKGMPLKELNVERTQVSDLSPLAEMPMEYLNIYNTPVSDLTPLKGMPLKVLQLIGSRVEDLSPLAGTPLEVLYCVGLKVSDLSPLKGMPLQVLACDRTQISDLSPLNGLPLRVLGCGYTKVSDLSPLQGMPLENVGVIETKVSDLSPLKGMRLKILRCDFVAERDAALLRAMSTLENINEKPATQFWKEVDERKTGH